MICGEVKGEGQGDEGAAYDGHGGFSMGQASTTWAKSAGILPPSFPLGPSLHKIRVEVAKPNNHRILRMALYETNNDFSYNKKSCRFMECQVSLSYL